MLMNRDNSTKNLILSSARTLFLEKGYDQTLVQEICTFAGCAKGTFFYYFETKQSIIRYILDEHLKRLTMRFHSPKNGTPQQLVRSFVDQLFASDAISLEVGRYFKESEPLWFSKMFDDMRKKYFYPTLLSALRAGKASGDFAIEQLDTTSELIFYAVNDYIHRYHGRIKSDTRFKESSYRGINELFSKVLCVKSCLA